MKRKILHGPCVSQREMLSLKKNTEGYDPIPQRVLIDGVDILIGPFSKLFHKIYHEK
jgi:hypothetical protein